MRDRRFFPGTALQVSEQIRRQHAEQLKSVPERGNPKISETCGVRGPTTLILKIE
jgi:hypothetical protein